MKKRKTFFFLSYFLLYIITTPTGHISGQPIPEVINDIIISLQYWLRIVFPSLRIGLEIGYSLLYLKLFGFYVLGTWSEGMPFYIPLGSKFQNIPRVHFGLIQYIPGVPSNLHYFL